jgi:hypothetical protein
MLGYWVIGTSLVSIRSIVVTTVRLEFDLLANKLPELLGRLHGLQPAVKVDRGLDIPMPEKAPHGLVITRVMFEIERRGGMPELMDGEPQSGGLLNPLGDLVAEHALGLRISSYAWEQP